MYKGVTPTFIFKPKDSVDLSQANEVWVTFATMGNREIFTKSGDELRVTSDAVEVFLTQEETLSFPQGKVAIQLNWIYDEGTVTKRACSNRLEITVNRNLKNEVLYG